MVKNHVRIIQQFRELNKTRFTELKKAYSLEANCRGVGGGGCNKWKWVEKVVAEKIYFQNRDKEGDKKCLKTFILVKYRNQ